MAKKNILVRTKKQKALKLIKENKLAEAALLLEKVCSIDASDIDTWVLLSTVYGQAGNYQGVKKCCENALSIDPNNITALSNLGNILVITGRPQEAILCYEKALKLSPESPNIISNIAALYYSQGEHRKAVEFWEKTLKLNPAHKESLNNLVRSYVELGDYGKTIEYGNSLLELIPEDEGILNIVANAYVKLAMFQPAIYIYQKILSVTKNKNTVYLALAIINIYMGEYKNAADYYKKVLEIDPNNIESKVGLIEIRYRYGDFDKAHKEVIKLIKGKGFNGEIFSLYARLCKYYGDCEDVVIKGKSIIERNEIDNADKASVLSSMGYVLDNIKHYQEAFEFYKNANDLVNVKYDKEKSELFFNDLKKVYSEEFLTSMPVSDIKSDKPVFVVGMPRSGTSLVEQIISSHSKVHGAGELNYINDIAHAFLPSIAGLDKTYPTYIPLVKKKELESSSYRYISRIKTLSNDALRVTDKMPQNFIHLGLISQLFPEAHIIHCIRNPLDTCLSIFFQRFPETHDYSFSLDNIAHYYIQYEKLMKHWKKFIPLTIKEIHYSDLIGDIEKASRGLVSFLGLEWDDRCLRYYESKRTVATASYDQVNKPVYRSSLERWRNYESQIDSLKEILVSGGVKI